MESLFGKTLYQIRQLTTSEGMPLFTASQIASWLYKSGVCDISSMTNISMENRRRLSEKYKTGLCVPSDVSVSADGTKKYLFTLEGGQRIEAAYIPDGSRATLCLSSQAGCRMGCNFCATSRMGFKGNLTAGEIVNQMAALPDRESLTNIVFMGMGEPLDNYDNVLNAIEILTASWGYGLSPARITVSTAGIIPNLKRLIEESNVHIAVSLHSPFSTEREAMMPVERKYPIAEVVTLLKNYDFSQRRRLSFEYIIMEGVNDSPMQIRELRRLLNGLKCRINLIRFHTIPGSEYASPSDKKVIAFRDALTAKGIHTTIRASRGEDIQAACGLLATGG